MTAKKLEIKRREAKRSKTKAYNILLSFAYVPRVRHHRIFFKGGINLPLHKSNQTPGFHCWLGTFLKFQDGARFRFRDPQPSPNNSHCSFIRLLPRSTNKGNELRMNDESNP